MKVTKENLRELCSILNKTFKHVRVMEYDGWTGQANPFKITKRSDEAESFFNLHPDNILRNSFSCAEICECPSETIIRLVSEEYDPVDGVKANYIIRIGMDIFVNAQDKQIVIIDSKTSLKRLLKTEDDVFTVFLFNSKESLNKLNVFVGED